MSQNLNTKLNKSKSIWVLVLLLTALVIASGVLVYSIIGSYSDGERNVIALIPGENGEGKLPEFVQEEVDGDDELWTSEVSVDLFLSSYVNDKGDVTVESSNGDAVIAPGTSNVYKFSLKNDGNIQMDFTMSLEGFFTLAGADLPIEIRLRSGNQYLVGGESLWLPASEIESVEITNTIERGKYINYILEWRWPFEGDSEQDTLLADLNDTLIGGESSKKKVNFKLDILTVATITEGAVPKNQDGLLMLTEIIPPVILYIVLGIIILCSIAGSAWYIISRKKNGQNND